MKLFLPALLATAIFHALPAAAEGDAKEGEKQFQRRCAICHSIKAAETKPTGPHLEKLMGRKAGTVDGFGFSAAMKSSNIEWNEKTLDDYLKAPTTKVPGTSMPAGAPQAADREDIIAYLKSLQ
jgi:cytochrome c